MSIIENISTFSRTTRNRPRKKVVTVGPFEKHYTVLTDTPWPRSLVGIFKMLLFCDDDLTFFGLSLRF